MFVTLNRQPQRKFKTVGKVIMNRNNVSSSSTLVFYFSILLTGVLGISVNSVFAKPATLFGATENPVVEVSPVSERMFAWFWDKKEDVPEEKPKPKVVAPPEQKTTPEVLEKKVIEKKEGETEEPSWWSPDAYQIIEKETPAEEKTMEFAPTAPAEDTKPVKEMKEIIPVQPMESPVMEVKPEAVETPEPTFVPEVVPDKKVMEVPPAAPIEKTKPVKEMKETVPVQPMESPVMETKPEEAEIPESPVAPEIVPEKKVMEVPPPAPVEKTEPVKEMKETVPEIKVTSTGFFKGPKACEECHEGEFKIWKETRHHTSFRTAHREPKDSAKPSPKKILKNVAGAKRMKRNKTCYLCHYTLQQKNADAKPVAKSGTSCESCHGASSEWLAIHDNYGGEGVMRMDETPEHKKQRIEQSAAKGLIWPAMKYQVVENCMTCHGLAHPELSGDVLAKMLGAGHPINPDFEAVKYSQGSVRHRYTPDDITNNREMTAPEKAELFVIGHAAALVSAREATSKSNEPKYTEAQNKRAQNAEAVLSLLTDIPEAAELIASPNRQNALKLVDALAGKDLTGKVGSLLPAKSDYK